VIHEPATTKYKNYHNMLLYGRTFTISAKSVMTANRKPSFQGQLLRDHYKPCSNLLQWHAAKQTISCVKSYRSNF